MIRCGPVESSSRGKCFAELIVYGYISKLMTLKPLWLLPFYRCVTLKLGAMEDIVKL
jgi:hypothetical protein